MVTSPSAGGREAAAVEAALTTLVRRAKLPDAHAAVAQTAGIALDRAAYVVLTRIDEWGPLRLSQLAERLGADVSTASRHVHHLELDGHVDRAEDPSDRRAWLLSLTPSGVDAVARVRSARQAAVARLLEDWPAEDRRELARLLGRLVESLILGDTQ
jgi:DNA-binding MarR family transcriptional regulator